MDELIIPYSRLKIGFSILASLGFVLLGVWMLLLEGIRFAWVVNIVAMVTILFFSFCAFGWTSKLFTQRPGLILNAEGFHKRLYGQDVFVKWADIQQIGYYKVKRQKIITIKLKDASEYTFRRNWFQTLWSTTEAHVSGTPITLTSNPLDIGFDGLINLLHKYWEDSTAN